MVDLTGGGRHARGSGTGKRLDRGRGHSDRLLQALPTGPGAIPFDELLDSPASPRSVDEKAKGAQLSPARAKELATDTKQSIKTVTDWAQEGNGPEVHQAWAAYSIEMQKKAELGEAAYAAGLAGIGEAGLP